MRSFNHLYKSSELFHWSLSRPTLKMLIGFLIKHKATLVLILGLLSFRWSIADHYRVPSGSMLPTIQIGDHILTNKLAYDLRLPFTHFELLRFAPVQRGDIVVFDHPDGSGILLVKRIIAVPGDHLMISEGWVYINGEKLKELFLTPDMRGNTEGNFDLTIPPDSYFAMGDNRTNSADSRYWGLVPRINIRGRAENVLWNITFEKVIPSVRLDRIAAKLRIN